MLGQPPSVSARTRFDATCALQAYHSLSTAGLPQCVHCRATKPRTLLLHFEDVNLDNIVQQGCLKPLVAAVVYQDECLELAGAVVLRQDCHCVACMCEGEEAGVAAQPIDALREQRSLPLPPPPPVGRGPGGARPEPAALLISHPVAH